MQRLKPKKNIIRFHGKAKRRATSVALLRVYMLKLLKVSVKQTLKGLAVSRFVACHLVYGVHSLPRRGRGTARGGGRSFHDTRTEEERRERMLLRSLKCSNYLKYLFKRPSNAQPSRFVACHFVYGVHSLPRRGRGTARGGGRSFHDTRSEEERRERMLLRSLKCSNYLKYL